MPSLVISPAPARGATTRPGGRFAATVLRLIAWPVRFWKARQDLAALGGLTDHELRDIGLMRTDLANMSALPRDVDPTYELARLVEERRHARR